MNKHFKKIAAVLAISTLSLSCGKDFLDGAVNYQNLDGDSFYQTEADATQAINAAYTILQGRALYKVELYALEYTVGDFAMTEGGFQYANFPEFKFNNTEAQVITNIWIDCYKGIARANAVLEKVPAIEFKNAATKTRILGEAHFLRGWYFFYLVNLYGDVPLMDHLVTGPEDPLFAPARTPKAQVWKFIEDDFTAAVSMLPKAAEYAAEDKGRATSGAAQGYLGKSYLYQKKFTEARDAFKKIVDGTYGTYSLMPSFEDNFLDTNENNAESLFEIQFLGGVGDVWAGDDTGAETESTYFGTLFGPAPQVFGNAYPSDDVNAVFDASPGDLRRLYTVARPGDVWKTWNPVTLDDWQPRIKNAGGNSAIRKGNLGPNEPLLQSSINWRLMRYSDVLLMYAEAENEVTPASPAAYAAINQVRARAGVPNLAAGMTKADFFNAIRTERRLELTFEMSRYFDLIRWGLGTVMPGFTVGKNELIPVPESEIIKNKNLLPNNPGW